MTSLSLTPMPTLMRYHGAKWRLASWIIDKFPKHYCYVEPFGGSAAVLINKPLAAREVYNDKNSDLVDLFRVIRCDTMRTELLRRLDMTPYSRIEFEWAKQVALIGNGVGEQDQLDIITKTHALLIRAQMGFGSAGATRAHTGFRLDTKRGGTSLQALWGDLPEAILEITKRLKNVILENSDAQKIIDQHDRHDTLFYIDPPYTLDTRTNKDSYGDFELSKTDHIELLSKLQKIRGMVVLSGYDNDLYNDMLQGWVKFSKNSAISSQFGSRVKTEILWVSPNCHQSQAQLNFL